MALSDACAEFLIAISDAARDLAKGAHWYGDPEYPIPYGAETDALKRAAAAVAADPNNVEATVQLVRLAHVVRVYYDASLSDPNLSEHERKMRALVRIIQLDLTAEDAADVPAIVDDISSDGPRTESAVTRLERLLPKLGKTTYDLAVKIIGDVASTAAKRMLGM